ncbi:hypothetical protein L4C34_10165 [Vibrio profundum]|uniref:hypothetical protein n=1 Tax=Vibrio profundum TaxID=2910247 RepID=UPI003D13E34F
MPRNIHGNWATKFENRILFSKVDGSTNHEQSLAMFKDIQHQVLSAHPDGLEAWVALTDARDWGLATEDSWESTNRVIDWMREHQCVFLAVAFSKQLQTYAAEQGFVNEGGVIQYFYDYDEAYQACLNKLKQIKSHK